MKFRIEFAVATVAAAMVPMGCAVQTNTVTDIENVCRVQDELIVDFDTCASSCDRVVEAVCQVEQQGEELMVTGHATIKTEGRTCTLLCGLVTARCPIPENVDPTIVVNWDGGPPVALNELDCDD